MKRRSIQVLTFGCLVVAICVALAGVLVNDPSNKFGLTCEAFALAGAITGVFAERWAAAKERRDQLLRSLAVELDKNATILEDRRFAPMRDSLRGQDVFPRILSSATDAALISGVFSDPIDARFVDQLHSWRNCVYEFNRRLDITELRLFTEASREEVQDFSRAMHQEDGYLDEIKESRSSLAQYLVQHYGNDVSILAALRTPTQR